MSLTDNVPEIGMLPARSRYRDRLRYGIELEYERWNGHNLNGAWWTMTTDGSLRNSGVELVSQPVTSEELDPTLDEAATLIRRGGLTATPRCGIHVHMNMRHLTAGQMFSFITAYTLLEPAIFLGFPERKTSSFCVPVYESGFTVKHIHNAVQASRSRTPVRAFNTLNNNSKYAALNTASLARFGTLEFRQMPATTRMSAVRKWVGLLTRIHDIAVLQDDPIQIVELYEGLGEQSFRESFLHKTVEVDSRDQRRAYIAAVQTAGFPEPEWDELEWAAPIA